MVMPTLDKIIVTVNSELFISSLIIGNSMERILHAPYHSWVPQAWVTCYFAHEWNKMQIILASIRGIVLTEGVYVWRWGGLWVGFHFYKCFKNVLLIEDCDLAHHLSIIIIFCAFTFCFSSRKVKASWSEGEDSIWWSTPAFPQKCFSSIPGPLSLAPLSVYRGKQGNICVALLVSLQPCTSTHRKALPLWHARPDQG